MADRTERAAVGRIELAYETFGDTGAPPMLLIAGLATQMLGWDERFCMQLADNGFHVIRFDNRDVGRSTHLDDAGVPNLRAMMRGRGRSAAPYTLVDMADDTAGLLDALGLESAHIVGMSMGGMIAQQLAISHPHRVRSLTSIMSTPSRAAGQARLKAQRVLFLPPATDQEAAAERALQGLPGDRLTRVPARRGPGRRRRAPLLRPRQQSGRRGAAVCGDSGLTGPFAGPARVDDSDPRASTARTIRSFRSTVAWRRRSGAGSPTRGGSGNGTRLAPAAMAAASGRDRHPCQG